jgi:hypothetical protein
LGRCPNGAGGARTTGQIGESAEGVLVQVSGTVTTVTLPKPVVVEAPLTTIEPAPQAKPPYRPAPNHIWRRSPIGRARFQPCHAKI